MASGSMVDRLPLSDADDVSRWPLSILLAEHAYVALTSNDTTATTNSRVDHIVTVSFWIADPPAVSLFTFHRSKLSTSDPEYDNKLEGPPHVVGVQGPFVLIRARFAAGDDEDEYFLYTGDTKSSPTLESIPLPDDEQLLHGIDDFGIVPRGGEGHYLLVALGHTLRSKDYRLHIYSSEDRAWTTKELLNPCRGIYGSISPHKVLMLGDSMLCWIDLLRGILVCDVLQEPLHARFIPLPAPLPGNREKLNQSLPGNVARRFRDVTSTDGVIKFVEMEHRVTVREIRDDVPPERPFDPRHEDVLHDPELMLLLKKDKRMDSKPQVLRSMNGWSALTWIRDVGSDCWLKRDTVDVDDILVVDSAFLALLSGERIESSKSFAFKDLYSAWPTLSIDSNDILYLKSYKQQGGSYVRLVTVDLAKKQLKVEAPGTHAFGNFPIQLIFRPCTLSNHIKMTRGIKVSACQSAQRAESENKRRRKDGNTLYNKLEV